MDRRTQLAFLLVAVILGVNLIVMERLAPKKDVQPSAATDSVMTSAPAAPAAEAAPEVPETSLAAAGDSSMATGIFPSSRPDAGEVIVRTPLYELRFSKAGGILTQVVLRRYELQGDGKVDLLPSEADPQHRDALGLLLTTTSGEIDLTKAQFEVQGDLLVSDVLEIESGGAPRLLTLRCPARSGGAVLQHYRFDPGSYVIGYELELERGPDLAGVTGYTLLWDRGLATTEVNQRDDYAAFKASARVNGEIHQHGVGGFGRGSGEKTETYTGAIDWVSLQTKYFTVAIIPESQEAGTVQLRSEGRTHRQGIELSNPTAWRKGPVETYRLYMGPIDYALLKQQGRGLEEIVALGWRFVRPVSKVILGFMKFLHSLIPNYGVVILILSTLTQLLFWPLSQKSFTSMRKMQNLQPLVQRLKETYKDDSQEMNRQMMALWKKEGVNPMGGCMPMVVQIPVLFALYAVLRSSIDLRGAPFVLWIDNLAAPDVLFTLPVSLPFLGKSLSLLPLLMGAAMIWRSAMSPTMPSTTPGGSQQQALMKWFMPIMMIFIFYKMPSGLVLYWLVNSLLGIWQQVLINRKFGPPITVGATESTAIAKQGGNDHAAPGRGDGRQRGRSARESAGRVGGKAR